MTKTFMLLIASALTFTACKSKQNAETANLPKDISLKPENNLSQQQDREELSALLQEIETLANSENCSNAADWRFAAIGSKPCGGPASYIAYPLALENEILEKIRQFTQKQSAFNTKYQLMSDCRMVMPPAGIKCVDGKAELISGNSEVSDVQ